MEMTRYTVTFANGNAEILVAPKSMNMLDVFEIANQHYEPMGKHVTFLGCTVPDRPTVSTIH